MHVEKGDVIQFVEKHKWRGCFGFVDEVCELAEGDAKVLIGVPLPDNNESEYSNIAYIYSLTKNEEFEVVGKAVIVPIEEEE